MVSVKGMLINKKPSPKNILLIKKILPQWKASFAVNSAVVEGLKIGTKNFARLECSKSIKMVGMTRSCLHLAHVPYIDYIIQHIAYFHE